MTTHRNDPISWMTRNTVPANLLMLIFLIGGAIFMSQVKQEIFPEFELDFILVNVPYPGASPEEVEEGIVLAIEDEVRGLDGVKKVDSTSREGAGSVIIELLSGVNSSKVLQDVKNVVDRIRSLPEEAERPVVTLIDARRQVISLMIHGKQDLRVLRSLAERVRDELIAKKGITLVELAGVPPLEIAIEVPQSQLRMHNLTLDQIAGLIRRTSIDLPAGGIKTPGGEILLRTQERRDYASEFADIDVVVTPAGTKVKLGDISTLKETFEETDEEAFFNGSPAVRVNVFRVGDQTPIEISEIVHDYIDTLRSSLPEGISVDPWDDSAEIFRDRIELLLRNAAVGLLLVLLLLGLFLEPRLAFWVTAGIPVSVIGSFLFIPITGASINMVSLFAFIVTLGIIVDDAIIVGEHIYQKREKGVPFLTAALEGAREIAGPVIFAVLTNIAAFLPLFFIPGFTGKIFLQIPAVVVSVLIVSLIESLFVLPSHLAHEHKQSRFWDILTMPSIVFEKMMFWFIHHVYMPVLRSSLRYRYLTLCCGLGTLIIAMGVFGGGYLQFSYFPRIDADIITSQVVLPFGVPVEQSQMIQERLVEAAEETIAESDQGKQLARGIYTQIGSLVPGGGPAQGLGRGTSGSHLVGAQVLLVSSEERSISGNEFSKAWRENLGEIPGIESINFSASIIAGAGKPLEIVLSHQDTSVLEIAAEDLADHLRNYTGVTDIDSGVTRGKPQISFKLKPQARSLGITARDLAGQVRSSFYGAEALRQQRGRNEIKVMVRLPEKDRKTIYTAEGLILRTAAGGEVPLSEAVEVSLGRSYTSIERTGGRRVLSVNGDVDEWVTNANEVIADLEATALPQLIDKYPGLTYTLEGQQREQQESLGALKTGFLLALVAIFALLAVPFKSYVQPLIVMMSIPFGIIGAVIGHLLLGYELSIISMFGIIALAGVVVNDSLVLIVATNENVRDRKLSPFDALLHAGTHRFRPIWLTSLTTFFGLTPMIFETSMQARFLIPMAISLGFGVLFATFITLLIVPALYLMIEDFRPSSTNRGRAIQH